MRLQFLSRLTANSLNYASKHLHLARFSLLLNHLHLSRYKYLRDW